VSYQVLARKWRPRTFREMVGQEHVLKALINALDHNRLHHAYLFTGTRGVGKTTIARILARCLNCEVGISSAPCGECSACREINEGRFIDLIEVDAASRTKVEDTRELLDNVQYAPTRGRFKIYLIDEVHMLSNHSFNALLKTLEEPPAHVKFLLATTDPQKLPITILSRCLQFNLKNMSPERIVQHLQHVLQEEMVPFDEAALWQLARSADGSMRDALSLTDQAIAFGSGKVAATDVSAMLGTIDHKLIEQLMAALIQGDGAALLNAVALFAEQSPDYHSALGDLITLLHRIAIAQALPEAVDNSYGDREQILKFAMELAPEDVQLFYQTGLLGRRDLPLAPDARSGFEMTLLRMLAFKPQGLVDVPSRPLMREPGASAEGTSAKKSEPVSAQPSASTAARAVLQAVMEPARPTPVPPAAVPPAPPKPTQPMLEMQSPPGVQQVPEVQRLQEAQTRQEPQELESHDPHELRELEELQELQRFRDEQRQAAQEPLVMQEPVRAQPVTQARVQVEQTSVPLEATRQHPQPAAPVADAATAAAVRLEEFAPQHWIGVYQALNVRGVLQSTASNCVLLERQGSQLVFALDRDKASLYDDSHPRRLADLLRDYFAAPVQVEVRLQSLPPEVETPAAWGERLRREAREAAIQRLRDDPLVQQLQKEFDASLDLESVTY
jgi:DNA polymerase-3 subunit gamma/tau